MENGKFIVSDTEAGGLSVRYATPSDASSLAGWWNDGAVMAHAGFPHGIGVTEEEIRESLAKDSDDTRRRFIIEYSDIPIGEMNYNRVDAKTAEIGIKICEAEYRNKGLGRKALSYLITSLFDSGYETIILDTDLENKRAQHVYESLGFVKLGIRYDSWRDATGALRSAVDYRLTKPEFTSFLN